MEYYTAIQRTKHLMKGETRRWLGPDSRLVGRSARSGHDRACVQERNGPRGCCRLRCIQATLTVIIYKNDEQPIPKRNPPRSLYRQDERGGDCSRPNTGSEVVAGVRCRGRFRTSPFRDPCLPQQRGRDKGPSFLQWPLRRKNTWSLLADDGRPVRQNYLPSTIRTENHCTAPYFGPGLPLSAMIIRLPGSP